MCVRKPGTPNVLSKLESYSRDFQGVVLDPRSRLIKRVATYNRGLSRTVGDLIFIDIQQIFSGQSIAPSMSLTLFCSFHADPNPSTFRHQIPPSNTANGTNAHFIHPRRRPCTDRARRPCTAPPSPSCPVHPRGERAAPRPHRFRRRFRPRGGGARWECTGSAPGRCMGERRKDHQRALGLADLWNLHEPSYALRGVFARLSILLILLVVHQLHVHPEGQCRVLLGDHGLRQLSR